MDPQDRTGQPGSPVPPGVAAARAVVEVLQSYGVTHAPLLRSIAASVDRMVQQAVAAPVNQGGSGFDPVSKTPSVSRLDYTHRARTREEALADGVIPKPTPTFRGKEPVPTPKIIVPGTQEPRRVQPRRSGSPMPWM